MNIEVDFVNSPTDDQKTDNFVNIYAITDERMQELGQALRTPKSRKIYQILMDRELHTKEIGVILDNEPNPRLPNLTHHLKKMTKIGMLTSTSRMKNGHWLTYYKSINYLMIVPDKDKEIAQKSKTLRNTIQKVFKISTIALVTISSYFIMYTQKFSQESVHVVDAVSNHLEYSLPLLVLSGSIGIERMFNFFNKRRSMKIE